MTDHFTKAAIIGYWRMGAGIKEISELTGVSQLVISAIIAKYSNSTKTKRMQQQSAISNRQSAIGNKQLAISNQQSAITTALEWTEQEYANFQFETGIAYLEHYIPTDRSGINMLSRSRIFWNWWKNHWNQRDAQFLSLFTPEFSHPKILSKVYYSFHDVLTLMNEIYPSAAILSDSYAVMIDDFHHEKNTTI